jgi:hypothetical protein
MLSLQIELPRPQAQALSHLLLQIPAHTLRECADNEEEAEAMRQALDVIRKALAEQGIQSA